MTSEQMQELEKLNERWANGYLSQNAAFDLACSAMDMIPDVLAHIKTAQNEWGRMRVDLEKAIGERDAAQKACAEMRDALAEIRDVPTVSSRVCLIAAKVLERTDCGKGYHKDSEWEPVVEALKDIRNTACCVDGNYVKSVRGDWLKDKCAEALAHAEKLMEGGK